MLNGQSINKQFKDLKPGMLNQNDFENISLKDLWKIPLQNQELNNDLEKLKNQFENASEDIRLRSRIKLQRYNKVWFITNGNESCEIFVAVKRD